MEPQSTRTLRVGDAISYGWNAFKRWPGMLILVVVIVWAISFAISTVGAIVGGDQIAIRLVFNLVGWVVSAMLTLGMYRVALMVTHGQEPDVGQLFVLEGVGRYLVASFLFGLGMMIGLVLLIVPGIIFAVTFGFYGVAIADTDVGIVDSFKRSAELTKGQRGTVFLLGLAFFGIGLLGLLACFVGSLVSGPVTLVATAFAYRTLAQEQPVPMGT